VTAAAVTTRRVSAGIRPDAGATSRLPAWWGAEDWHLEVLEALQERPELLPDHHVSRDAVLAVARSMAAYADHRTGRDCRPTNARLVEGTRFSLSVVQRARRVLKAAGLVVQLVAGRSIMTRAERLEAWKRGSSHRMVAAEFALTSRPRRAPKVGTTKLSGGAQSVGADLHIVDGDTPPGAESVSTSAQLRSSHLRRQTENEDRRSAPSSCRGEGTAAARRLAETTRSRLGWLHGTSWRRLAPTLARFARAGWTVADVELAVRDSLGAHGWRVPRELKYPAAYLAGLLRATDPEARPTVEAAAHEAWLREQAAAERATRRARVLELRGACAHGVPAHGAGQPRRGVAACPECRP